MSCRKVATFILFMFLFSMFSLSIVKAPIQVDRYVYTMKDAEGHYSITQAQTTYSGARNKTSGNLWSEPIIGQWTDGFAYYVWKTYFHFDLTFLPPDANITEAKISLYLKTNHTDTDFNITIQSGAPTYPHFPLEDTDCYYGFYSGNGGTFDTSNLVEGYNDIILNSEGMSWINLTHPTKLCLRSDRDINSQAPTGFEYVVLYDIDDGESVSPKLTLTYNYEEEESAISGSENGEPTTIIDIPEITVPKFHIPVWGYYLILGSIAIVAFASILSKPPRSSHGPNGTKIRKTKTRMPKRNKKGRFTK